MLSDLIGKSQNRSSKGQPHPRCLSHRYWCRSRRITGENHRPKTNVICRLNRFVISHENRQLDRKTATRPRRL
jgi:hypothetical protein